MKNKIIYETEAREAILQGFEEMYKVVSTSLGPLGNNIAIDKGHETIVIHDGYNIAKSVKIDDPYKKVGADMLFQAIQRQVDEVGDGTTLITILARNIAKEANKLVAAGVNAMTLRYELEKVRDEVIEMIEKQSTPVTTLKQKIQVATVSSANKELGKLIGETIHEIGEDGISTVEESNNRETIVEMQDGFQIENGWRLPQFITNPEDSTAVLEDAKVLVTDMVLSDAETIASFVVKEILPRGKTIFIIAQDYEGMVLPTLALNKMNGKLNVLCVQAPLFENIQKDFLGDIATLTGATLVSEDSGLSLKDLKYEHLGFAKKIKATRDATILTGGNGNKKSIEARIKSIRNEIEEQDSGFEIAKRQERLARLIGKVAVIKVGGATEIEMRERKERVEDAVEATKTATKSGIVSGGEITLLNIAKEIDNPIMANALQAPFNKLMSNSGMDAGEYKQKIQKSKKLGVNVKTGDIENLMDEGIIDPTGVLTSAVYNSVNIAIQAFTSEAVIPFIKEKND